MEPVSRSRLEPFEKPVGPDHVGAQCLGPTPELAIGRDEYDLLVGRTTGDVDQHVVAAAALGMDDLDTVGEPGLYALASLALEDYDDRLGDPLRQSGGSDLAHECAGCPGAVPPPARWTGPDDIGRVDEEHRSSLVAGRKDEGRNG